MLFLVIGDELCDFRIRSDRLYEYYVVRAQKHAVWTVPLIASPNQDVVHCLGLLIYRALDVVHIGQLGVRGSGIGELAEVDLIIVQQNGGIGGCDLRPVMSMSLASNSSN